MITFAVVAALAMPPHKFDHYPKEAFKIVELYDNRFLEALCPVPEGWWTLSCTMGRKVYIRNDFSPKAKAHVLRHEYGHLNGWHH